MDQRLDARLREIPPGGLHDLVTKLSAIDEFKGWWAGRGLSDPSLLRHLKKRTVEISAAASLRIGGSDRPHMEVRERLGSGVRNREEPGAAHRTGYAELLRTIFDDHRELCFGQDLILQFHATLLKYSHADQAHRGKYKMTPDTARSYLRRKMESPALRSTDPDLTPRAMTVATEWARTRLASTTFHPLLVIAGFVLELLAIRPFVNGNGRVSRILTNFLLLRCGYTFVPCASLETVIADRWPEYYLALRQSQAHAHLPRPDITPWLSAFLDAIRMQTRDLRAAIEWRPDASVLSENQLGVLNLLERNAEVTNRLVCSELHLPKDTAKQVLNRLLALNFVRRVGSGRAVRYRKAPHQDDGGTVK
jgi:Fic family protein